VDVAGNLPHAQIRSFVRGTRYGQKYRLHGAKPLEQILNLSSRSLFQAPRVLSHFRQKGIAAPLRCFFCAGRITAGRLFAKMSESIFEGGEGAGPADATTEGAASTSTYQASASASANVDQLLAQDTEDESLRKYKEQLLGAAAQGDLGDANDPRKVIGTEFRVMFEDETLEDVVFVLEPSVSGASFSMKEGFVGHYFLAHRLLKVLVSGPTTNSN
jgi:hypothetical protein